MADCLDLVTPYFPVYMYASSENLASSDILDQTVSAILGGNSPVLKPGEEWPRCTKCCTRLIPYIQINVSCLQTPEEFRSKLAAESQPGQTTIFQVLLCAEDESVACFDETVVGDPEGGAWLVRVLHVSTVDTEAIEKVRSDMRSDKFFINERVITHWTHGRPEVEHSEVNWEIDEELYEQHKPAWGLKLLGWPVSGGSSRFRMALWRLTSTRQENTTHLLRSALPRLHRMRMRTTTGAALSSLALVNRTTQRYVLTG